MESDAILEGFKSSLEVHGLVYKTMIADGDSSVYKKIRDCNPYDNTIVKKIECTNHLLRNLAQKVKAVSKTKGSIGRKIRETVDGSAHRFQIAVRKAVEHWKAEPVENRVQQDELRKDILNMPSHIFGEHKDCASRRYFCDGRRKVSEENIVPELMRLQLYEQLQTAVTTLSSHVESLLFDVNSNRVEQFNAIICKLIGGKRINFALTNSYQTRCAGSVIRFNSQKPLTRLSQTTQATPSTVARNLECRRKRRNLLKARRKRIAALARMQMPAAARRAAPRQKPATADKDYGPDALRPDMEPDVYDAMVQIHVDRLVEQQQRREEIERATTQQAENDEWLAMRKKLLTASNFGSVCRMTARAKPGNQVKRILYSPDLKLPALEYGRVNETKARKQMQEQLGVEIMDCGLFIDSEIPYLGATPDGLIGDDGIVEIKCPYSARQLTPEEAIRQKTAKVNKIFTADQENMSKDHVYFYQVQGQLHITQRNFCVFALWTPLGLKMVTVQKDDQFWTEKMEPRLERFYQDWLLPEIIDSRFARGERLRGI